MENKAYRRVCASARGLPVLDNDAEYTSVHDADIHVCIFPNLDEFILLDYRNAEKPTCRVVPSSELLPPQYYQELEKEFTRILYSGEAPFANLMALPQRLEYYLRAQGMRRLSAILQPNTAPQGDPPRVSVLLCGSAMTAMGEEDLTALVDSFFEDGPPPAFVKEYTATFLRLLAAERAGIHERELDELRRAVQGRSNQFFTLWQNRAGSGLN